MVGGHLRTTGKSLGSSVIVLVQRRHLAGRESSESLVLAFSVEVREVAGGSVARNFPTRIILIRLGARLATRHFGPSSSCTSGAWR